MRLSSNKGERGYGALQDIFRQGKVAHVILDGVEVKKAIAADDEEGIVIACVLDEEGNLTTNDDGDIKTRELRGNVSIEIRDRH